MIVPVIGWVGSLTISILSILIAADRCNINCLLKQWSAWTLYALGLLCMIAGIGMLMLLGTDIIEGVWCLTVGIFMGIAGGKLIVSDSPHDNSRKWCQTSFTTTGIVLVVIGLLKAVSEVGVN